MKSKVNISKPHPISAINDTNSYEFYCKKILNPIVNDERSQWEPYSPEIQILLNKQYSLFLKGKISNIKLPSPLNHYYIDFSNQHQISHDQSKIRPIKILPVSAKTQVDSGII